MSGFFSKFVSGEINESEFEEGLQKYITQLQTLKKCEESQVKEISKAALQIKDEIFNKNIELWLKLSLHMSNRLVYYDFTQQHSDFSLIELNEENQDANQLCLYVLKRVYYCENHKVLLIFLNRCNHLKIQLLFSVLREQKQTEKKLLFLEIYTSILPLLEKREVFFPDILPLILMVINEALQRYLKYRQQQHDNTLNEENKGIQIYMANFQKWTVSFFKRIFDQLRKTPEIKANSAQKVISDLYTIDEMYDYDPITDQIFQKAEKPQLVVKHLILLFLFDLLEGILEANQSLTSSHIDPSIVNELLSLVMGMVKDVHNNKLELIENYLLFARFSLQRNQQIQRQFHRYDKTMLYNPVAMAYFVHLLLFTDNSEYKNIQAIFSSQHKLLLCVGVLLEEKKINETKCDIKQKLIYQICNILEQTKDLQLESASYFITQFHHILLEILEKAGQNVSQQDQEHYLKGWKSAEKIFSFDCWVCILNECVNASMNYELLSHLINNFRNYSNDKFKEGSLTKEKYLRGMNLLVEGVNKKCRNGTVEQKINLIDSMFLLMQYTMRKVGHKDEEWKKVLDYFEKEINQSLDYLNAKRQSDVIDINYNYLKDKSKEGDQVYQQLAQHENQMQIAKYNLDQLYQEFKQAQ